MGIYRFSVDLTIEVVVWWSLRVISAKWLAEDRLLPSVYDNVITVFIQPYNLIVGLQCGIIGTGIHRFSMDW